MAQQDYQLEYIVTQAAYNAAYASLPDNGYDDEINHSLPVLTRQFRLNISDTINSGKWSLWAIEKTPIKFTWQDGEWVPPHNLVIVG